MSERFTHHRDERVILGGLAIAIAVGGGLAHKCQDPSPSSDTHTNVYIEPTPTFVEPAGNSDQEFDYTTSTGHGGYPRSITPGEPFTIPVQK